MVDFEQLVLKKVRESFDAVQIDSSIVYWDSKLKAANERLAAGDAFVRAPCDFYLAFVDLEPRANWGHDCAYIAVCTDGKRAIKFAAHMPPFLKDGPSNFHFLWRGPLAPEWAIAANSQESGQ
jgi:hypothetical protein